MRSLATFLIVFVSVGLIPVCAAIADEPSDQAPLPIADADNDTTAIEGEWQVKSLDARGRADSGVSFRGMRFTFDKDTWTTWAGDTTPAGLTGRPPLKAKYTIDNSQNPKHLDMIVTHGESTITKKCLYKIDDAKLIICLGRTERPTGFDTKAEDCLCYTAERIAPINDLETGPGTNGAKLP